MMNAEAENPSMRDERSEVPYNEDRVSSSEMLERLKEEHPEFKGDWYQLERLVRNLDEDKSREGLEPGQRLLEWDDWAEEAEQRCERVHLEGANLRGARLEGAILEEAHLERADLKGAHLEQAHLSCARLDGASLDEAHLEKAWLDWAWFNEARLWKAHLEGADLFGARLEGANLIGAHLEGAKVKEAVFDRADIRGATGLLFDDNSVFRTRIEGNAKDPWSVLRRSYTGPRFFFHLLLLVVFFAPYAGRVLTLSAVAHGQEWLEQKGDEIVETVDERSPEAAAVVESTLAKAHDEFQARFRQERAVWVLIGWTKGKLSLVMALIVIAYNVCRGYLTYRVSGLRDAEERAQVTPRLDEYLRWYRVHRYFVRVLLWVAGGSVIFNSLEWVLTTYVPVPV